MQIARIRTNSRSAARTSARDREIDVRVRGADERSNAGVVIDQRAGDQIGTIWEHAVQHLQIVAEYDAVVKAQLRNWTNTEGTVYGTMLFLWCPGCDSLHGVELVNPPTTWQWDGNLDAPTISPSILTHMNGRDSPDKCHAFVRAGKWEFLSDSFHSLAGQTVDMVDLPDWVTD